MLSDFKDAFRRYNNGHVQLIIINVVIFLALAVLFIAGTISKTPAIFNVVYEQITLPSHLDSFLYKPWTLLTYGFAHHFQMGIPELKIPGDIGIAHIVFNMIGLYMFGRVFVEFLGSDKLIAVYVLGVLAGGLLYLTMHNTIPFFMERPATLVGASAAVFAVMTAVATLLPDYTFYLLLIGPVKVKYIALVYIVLSFLFITGANAGGELSHLGGALMGFVYIRRLQAGSNWGQWITVTLDWIKGLFSKRSKIKVSYRNQEYAGGYKQSGKAKDSSSVSQDEIDAILDKISAGGYQSLTKDEKEKLFHASKRK